MAKRCILGALLTNRVTNATSVQSVLTECGCFIKTRIGLHEATDNICSPSGLIVLELIGDDAAFAEVEAKLGAVPGVEVQKMVFEG
jgi:hypothetical protein